MAEVVRALEGEIAPIECITADADGVLVCSREHHENHEPVPHQAALDPRTGVHRPNPERHDAGRPRKAGPHPTGRRQTTTA